MILKHLSDAELRNALESLRGSERETTLKILFHLIELEDRGLFREEGYSSMYDYCVRKLKYPDGSAYNRIAAARCLKDNREIAELFLSGKVNLSTIAVASKSIREKVTEVNDLVGKSKREVETLIYSSMPVPKKPVERIKPLAIELPKAPLLPDTPKEERYELKFSVSKEVYENFTSAKARLSNSLQSDLSLEAVFGKLLELYLNPKERKSEVKSSTRYIPRSLKRLILNQDQGQCTFVSKDGTRCTERHYLQFDHIQPYALGGKSEAQNLRLLCSTHNRFLAEQTFG